MSTYHAPSTASGLERLLACVFLGGVIVGVVYLETRREAVAEEPKAAQRQATGRIAKQITTPDGRLADYDAKTKQYWVQDFSVQRPLTKEEVRECTPVPGTTLTTERDGIVIHWQWPQPHGEDAATWQDDVETWIEAWAKHRYDPQTYRQPGPPQFPQSWNDVNTEYDQVQYETMLEVHRFYADRINELETRLEKLEDKLTPDKYDDEWPVVN